MVAAGLPQVEQLRQLGRGRAGVGGSGTICAACDGLRFEKWCGETAECGPWRVRILVDVGSALALGVGACGVEVVWASVTAAETAAARVALAGVAMLAVTGVLAVIAVIAVTGVTGVTVMLGVAMCVWAMRVSAPAMPGVTVVGVTMPSMAVTVWVAPVAISAPMAAVPAVAMVACVGMAAPSAH